MNEELANIFYSGLKIDGVSVWEYYKNKPLDYEKSIDFLPMQKTFNRIDESHIKKYSNCELAIISSYFANPYYKPVEYIESKGYKIEEWIPGTGSSAAIISKII